MSLLKELAALTKPAPRDIDPETAEGGLDSARRSTATRRAHTTQEDQRYRGHRVSRAALRSSHDVFHDGEDRIVDNNYDDDDDIDDDDDGQLAAHDDEEEDGSDLGRAGRKAAKPKGKAKKAPAAAAADENDEDYDDEDENDDLNGFDDQAADGFASDNNEDDDDYQEGADEDEDKGTTASSLFSANMGARALAESKKKQEEFRALQQEEAEAVGRLSSDVDAQVEKGRHAKNQLLIWEALMEQRIRLQRLMTPCNTLPVGDTWAALNVQTSPAVEACRTSVAELANALLELQSAMVGQFPVFASASSDEKEPSLLVDQPPAAGRDAPGKRAAKNVAGRLEDTLAQRHKRFKPLIEDTVDKWNTKTKLASHTGDKGFKALDRRVVTQIEEIVGDRQRLIKRTQLVRGQQKIIGLQRDASAADPEEKRQSGLADDDVPVDEDEEDGGLQLSREGGGRKHRVANQAFYHEGVFDDTDFYHELLRDLVQRKTEGDSTDPLQMSRQWLEVDRFRVKNKRLVDTRASKGRKLRYDVHPKLVSFLAPDETAHSASDAAKDAICASLFADAPAN